MTRRPRVDVVLVNPGGRKHAYQGLGKDLAAIENPVWPGLIATFIRRCGYSVEVLDANLMGWGPGEVAERIEDLNPLITAVVVYGHNPSASTQVMPSAGAICSAIKSETPEQKLLLLGGHVAALPERTLREEDVDFVCTGEGCYTLADLVQAYRESASPELGRVRGICFMDGSGITRTRPAPLVQDLNGEMPGIAWDLVPVDQYRAHNWHAFETIGERSPYASIYTTLGCPHRCSFCCIQAPFKSGEQALGMPAKVNSYRKWSPALVLSEIRKLVEHYGVRHIKFADELFVMHRKHVDGICDGIIERGYDLNIWAYARVDSIKEGMLPKLRQAGVRWLALGIEAASERVRDDVNKGFRPERLIKLIEEIRAAGIHVIGNYIFGLPEDDLASMQQTLDLAIELNCEMANFYCAMAYPGSALYQQALTSGARLPASWGGYSQFSRDALPLDTKHIRGEEVLRFRDQAFTRYFSAAPYLEMVGSKFGSETRAHIESMTARRLERDHLVPAGTI